MSSSDFIPADLTEDEKSESYQRFIDTLSDIIIKLEKEELEKLMKTMKSY